MNKNKHLAWAVVGFFLTGCTGMTKNQAALVGAATCGAMGAAGGAVAAHHGIDGKHRNEAVGAGIGAVSGALICGGLAYLLTEEPKPKPKPAPPPPPPPPPKPKPKPAPPPPPPPPAPKPKPAPKVERTIILDDVLFDFDRSTIKPEAAAILDRLVAFMNENKDKKVSLSGHTDSVGTDEYNQSLSERRAQSVQAALFERGVEASQISTVGKGETTPVASNDNAAGRQQNRRVELVFQEDRSKVASDSD